MSAFFEVGDAEFQAWVQKVQAKANPEASSVRCRPA